MNGTRRGAEGRLREALREAPVPGAEEARERALGLVRASYAAAPPQPAVRRSRRRALQLAVALGLIAALVSPAGASIRHWVRDAVEVGHQPSLPALTSLPAPGSLLVDSPRGPWVVHADGSKRLLGDYVQSTWSPHGLYVAVTNHRQLATVDPEGDVHWALSRLGPVRDPAWSPDGERIAYLDGDVLRVVAGDGTEDRPLARNVMAIAPAWQPGERRRLAFVDAAGAVEVLGADSGRHAFDFSPGPGVIRLAWSADGARLLVVRRAELQVRDRRGGLLWRVPAPPGTSFRAAALAPNGRRVTAVLSTRAGAQSKVLLLGPGGQSRQLFAGLGRFGEAIYSPDGRWLLVTWRSADQWLFLNPAHPRALVAISDISRQFDPGTTSPSRFPSVAGWCCLAPPPQG
jgi:hypothetical protein